MRRVGGVWWWLPLHRQIRNGHHWPVRTLSGSQVSEGTSEATEGFFVSALLAAGYVWFRRALAESFLFKGKDIG